MTSLGRYQIVGLLGRGGMGTVYRAFDPIFERQVAIKTILQGNISPERAKRFLREIRAAGRLSHNNIVMSLDAGQDAGMVYVVMEFIEGRDLGKMLRTSPVSTQRVVEILSAVACALDYAHSTGIVHRDVKPANIIVGAAGSVKLADFGIAKLLDRESITTRGKVIGTPQYIAPELWKGGHESGRCDQFSLAVVAYEALVGSVPFHGESLWALAQSITENEPPGSKELSNETYAVLRKALSKEPSDRFDSCTEFIAALVDTHAGTVGQHAIPAAERPPETVTLIIEEETRASAAMSGSDLATPKTKDLPVQGSDPLKRRD